MTDLRAKPVIINDVASFAPHSALSAKIISSALQTPPIFTNVYAGLEVCSWQSSRERFEVADMPEVHFGLLTAGSIYQITGIGRSARPSIAGEVSIVPPGLKIDGLVERGFAAVTVHAPLSVIAQNLGWSESDVLNATRLQFGLTDPFLASAIHALGDAISAPSDNSLFGDSIAIALMHYFSRFSNKAMRCRSVGVLKPTVLRRVKSFIEEKLAERLLIGDIAEHAGISTFHLCRAFKASTGETLSKYITRRRIERAMEIIKSRHGGLSIVAQMVGFSSQSHFTTAFRRVTGTTPHAYSRQIDGYVLNQ